MLNIAVLVSGGGTNLQALLDSEARGENPNGKITLVVASKPGVYALERCKGRCGESAWCAGNTTTTEDFDAALLGAEHTTSTLWCWQAFCRCWGPASSRPIRAAS